MDDQSEEIEVLKQAIMHVDSKQDYQTEILNDIRVNVARQEASLESHTKQDEQMYHKINSMDERLGDYNQLLAIHIEGVKQLRITNELLERKIDQHQEELEIRLNSLEAPRKILSGIKNSTITISKVAAAIMAIAAFLKWIGVF